MKKNYLNIMNWFISYIHIIHEYIGYVRHAKKKKIILLFILYSFMCVCAYVCVQHINQLMMKLLMKTLLEES